MYVVLCGAWCTNITTTLLVIREGELHRGEQGAWFILKDKIVVLFWFLSQSRSKGNMQAYCQLARQGLGLMIFLLSGGRGRRGRGDRKPCQDVLCCVVYFTGYILYYIIFLHCPPSTPHHHHNIISPLPPLYS